jgi:hypothetical protein
VRREKDEKKLREGFFCGEGAEGGGGTGSGFAGRRLAGSGFAGRRFAGRVASAMDGRRRWLSRVQKWCAEGGAGAGGGGSGWRLEVGVTVEVGEGELERVGEAEEDAGGDEETSQPSPRHDDSRSHVEGSTSHVYSGIAGCWTEEPGRMVGNGRSE